MTSRTSRRGHGKLALALLPALFAAHAAHAASYPAWQADTYYAAGTIVYYSGHDYKALVSQTDYASTGWNPTNASLWTDLGADTGSATPTPAPTATPKPTATPIPVTGTPTPTTKPTVTPTPVSGGCTAAAWNSSTAYNGGAQVSYNGHTYTAKWWTQGNIPSSSTGDGQPWTDNGVCGPTPTPTATPTVSPTPVGVTPPAATQLVAGTCPSDPALPVWTAGTSYASGQRVRPARDVSTFNVMYNGSTYPGVFVAAQAHTATAATEPTAGLPQGGWSKLTYNATYWAVGAMVPPPCAVPTPTPVATPTPTITPTVTPTPVSGTAPAFIYSPYKDVTVNTDWNTDMMRASVGSGKVQAVTADMPAKVDTLTWAFVTGECGSTAAVPSGENLAGMDPTTFVNTNVPLFTGSGKKYVVSTGGAAGVFSCGSDAGFAKFINHYYSANMIGVDFDIEAGQTQAQITDLVQRVIVAQKTWPNLRFSFTLATLAQSKSGSAVAVDLGASSPNPLGDMGKVVMSAIQAAGLKNYTVNLMTMDYGNPPSINLCVVSGSSCQMGQSAIQAAMNLHNFYNLPYSQIEVTPMILANDVGGENFSLSDADVVAAWVKANGLAGLHHWSYDRDQSGAAFSVRFATGLGL
ncbi:Carbohydrate binding domain-containing protein [Andreprevotia lacus DSM 23236]|jgi:chitodextrinase|uniref:Carbohydrate binding domain-containing protein n=1 Tax=Andreprevotia lacus DSM 23236 TaxID=1121001 RepID=A0A1W1XKB5_9NEIS|nr:carbohydrate-binding protein [Andreprevotia lacus]SMC24375.1 Carbohydrate binding domain-containing protein [Andreprevotia lacus DSM 23236]